MHGDCYVPDNRGHTRARMEFPLFDTVLMPLFDTVLMHRDDNPSVVLRQLDALPSFLRDIDESAYGGVMPGPATRCLGPGAECLSGNVRLPEAAHWHPEMVGIPQRLAFDAGAEVRRAIVLPMAGIPVSEDIVKGPRQVWWAPPPSWWV